MKPVCRYCSSECKRRGLIYCSNQCQQEFQYRQFIERWLRGDESGSRKITQEASSSIRRYLIEQADNRCSQCKWGEVNRFTGKVPLELDHIDGCHWNNSPTNVRVLCPNCHSLTPTFRGRNKGQGRKLRKSGGFYLE